MRDIEEDDTREKKKNKTKKKKEKPFISNPFSVEFSPAVPADAGSAPSWRERRYTHKMGGARQRWAAAARIGITHALSLGPVSLYVVLSHCTVRTPPPAHRLLPAALLLSESVLFTQLQ